MRDPESGVASWRVPVGWALTRKTKGACSRGLAQGHALPCLSLGEGMGTTVKCWLILGTFWPSLYLRVVAWTIISSRVQPLRSCQVFV